MTTARLRWLAVRVRARMFRTLGAIGGGSVRYRARLASEIARYDQNESVHDLPPIFHYWSNKYVKPLLDEVVDFAGFEDFYARHILKYAAEHPGDAVRIASIGAGNGDIELQIGALLKQRGLAAFTFSCVDINPAMLRRGRDAAARAGLAAHFEFVEADVSEWTSPQPLGVVMANHSLHHIQRLEPLFDRIKTAIGDTGYFLSGDMIGRNGHMRWPEALAIIEEIWTSMPDRYKRNNLDKRVEPRYQNRDYSTSSFEGIRAQDILPLLLDRFHFEAFVGFGNLPDIFVDRIFGHNFDPANPEDLAFIDRVATLNDRLIDEGRIKPTQMLAVMRATGSGPCRCHRHWTPEFCVRRP